MGLMTRERVTLLLRLRELLHLFPPPKKKRSGAAFWERGLPTKLAMGCQKLCGSNKYWKKRNGYHKRSLSETAMIKALNKFTGLGMPETYRID